MTHAGSAPPDTQVAICLALHNPRLSMLVRQLDSIENQSESRWLALVLDDGSSSSGQAVIEEAFAGRDPRRWRWLEPSAAAVGPYLAFERLARAAAELELPVAFADQDDWWAPAKLERHLSLLTGDVALVFGRMIVVDERDEVLRPGFLAHEPTPAELTADALLTMNVVTGTASLVAPRVVSAALPFPGAARSGRHDQWLATLAARMGTLRYDPFPCVRYTIHAGQVTGMGLRRLTAAGARAYLAAASAAGVSSELRARTEWVVQAARAGAQRVPVGNSSGAYIRGRLDSPTVAEIARSVWEGRAPLTRGLLLVGGLAARPRVIRGSE